MLNVILGILMVSLVSASGFMLIEQMTLTAAVADQRENARRLDVVADAASARMGAPSEAPDGMLFASAPAPAAGGSFDYAQLSDKIPGVHSTVSGIPFRYCPYAPAVGPIKVSGDYVVEAPAAPAAIRAFQPAGVIIAAGIKASLPPACDAVTVTNGRVTVPGGLVRVISGIKGISATQAAEVGSFDMWVAPDANGSGSSPSQPASLVAAMNLWKTKLPKAMLIHVPANAVFADDDAGSLRSAFSLPSQPSGTVRSSKLSIVSDGGAIISANASFDPQGALALVGVSLPQTVIRVGSHNAASLQNARVAGVVVDAGSSVAFNGGVSVQGGGVVVAGDATVGGSLEVVGSASADLITVPSGGRLLLSGGSIALRGGSGAVSGIALGGDLGGSGSIGGAGAGVREVVRLVPGGRMSMSGSLGGVVSGFTVLGDGIPASLTGSLTVGSGSSGCWNIASRSIFQFSTPQFSAVSDTAGLPPEPAAPVADENGSVPAAEMTAYVAANAAVSRARADRAAAQAVNRSSWSCGS